MSVSAPGSARDKEKNSYVVSPTRPNQTAQEVFVGNFALEGGVVIDPLAKFVEAIYTDSNKTVTYNYYESASKVTLYNTIVTTYSVAQDTEFTSALWD